MRGLLVAVAAALAGTGCAGGPRYSFDPLPSPTVVSHETTDPTVRFPPDDIERFLEVLGPPRATQPVRFAFVGDINLGTLTLDDGVPPDSGRGLLSAVAPFLVGDLVVGNFESTLADSGTPAKCLVDGRVRRNCYAFVTPTYLAPRLTEAGFTHITLANNHANDLGATGRVATAEGLHAVGLRVVGPLGLIAIDTLWRGDSVTVVGLIGFATYAHSYDLLDLDRSAAVVDSVRPLVDVLVVTFHGGNEGSAAVHTPDGPEFLGREPRGDLRRWSRQVIDAGADAVIGHGPHVLRGIEFYRGRPIVYSLGNFVTYRGFNLSGPLGVTGVVQMTLGPGGVFREGRLIALVQPPRTGPMPDASGEAVALVRRVSREDFGPSAAAMDRDGTFRPPAVP
jgi:hypothetical protein